MNAHAKPKLQCPLCLRTYGSRFDLHQHLRATRHSAAIGDVHVRRVTDSVAKIYATAKRTRAVTVAQLDAFDNEELHEGYKDGFDGEPQPGANRGDAYFHGWCVGMMDKGRLDIDETHRQLTRAFVAEQKRLRETPSPVAMTAAPTNTDIAGLNNE